MSLPFGLTPLPPRPTSFSTLHPSTISRSPSPTSSIRSIQSLRNILIHHYHHRRRPSTTSVIPSARSSMFGKEVESEDVAVMGVMEPRPDEGGRWVGIGEVLGGW